MKYQQLRPLLAEGAIGLSLVAGAYFFAIDPLQRSVVEARENHDASYMSNRGFDPAHRIAEIASLRQRLNEEAASSDIASDELDVMARINREADRTGLQIENIEKRVLPAADTARGPEATAALKESRFGFSISCSGSYAQTVEFLDFLRNDLGYTSIDSIRLTPAGDTRNPRLNIVAATSHWWFDVKPALHAIEGVASASGSEAQP